MVRHRAISSNLLLFNTIISFMKGFKALALHAIAYKIAIKTFIIYCLQKNINLIDQSLQSYAQA